MFVLENYIKAVYDVTIAYGENTAQSELDFVKGNLPRDIRFHVNRIDIGSVPDSDEEMGDWLRNIWTKKEEALRHFYESTIKNLQKSITQADPSSTGESPTIETDNRPIYFEGWRKFLLYTSFLGWLFFSCYWGYFLIKSLIVKVYFLIVIITYVYLGRKYGGVERWVIMRCVRNSGMDKKVD